MRTSHLVSGSRWSPAGWWAEVATYGCCITHSASVSHEEHMDAFDREQNQELLGRARELIEKGTRGEGTHADYLNAQSLLGRFAELERVRLAEKERLMRAGQWPGFERSKVGG